MKNGLSLHGSWEDGPWWFRAILIRVIDGDTIDVLANGGFGNWSKQRLRLAITVRPDVIGMDAPECRGPTKEAGKAATDELCRLLKEHSFDEDRVTIKIKTAKRVGKYGRYISSLHGKNGVNICQLMVDSGHAVEKNY